MKRAIVSLLALVAMIALAFFGWIKFNEGSEWSLPWTSAPRASGVASAAAESAAPDLWWRPPASEEASWRKALTAACAAGAAGLQSARIDVDGDEVADTVCWRVRSSKVYGDFVEVAAHVVARDGAAKDAYIDISVAPADSTDGSHGEPGLIGLKTVSVQLDSLDKDKVRDLDTGGHYGRCLRVTTETGDKIWLFWVPDARTEESRFYYQTPYN